MKTETKCMNQPCDDRPVYRGLCSACYQQAATLVRESRTTWKKLEALGRALPKQRRNRAESLLAK